LCEAAEGLDDACDTALKVGIAGAKKGTGIDGATKEGVSVGIDGAANGGGRDGVANARVGDGGRASPGKDSFVIILKNVFPLLSRFIAQPVGHPLATKRRSFVLDEK
jgi:hypothetical protein